MIRQRDIVGFTGTSDGMTMIQRHVFRQMVTGNSGEFHHGLCVGADEEAHEIVRVNSLYRIVGHPPIISTRRARVACEELRDEKSYLARNRDIAREVRVLVAAPRESDEVLRSGTWSTVRYARLENKPIIIVRPDGVVVTEIRNPSQKELPLPGQVQR